jgi:hypothetical protein
MPRWAVGKEKDEAYEGRRCRWASRVAERGEWLPGRAQPGDAA